MVARSTRGSSPASTSAAPRARFRSVSGKLCSVIVPARATPNDAIRSLSRKPSATTWAAGPSSSARPRSASRPPSWALTIRTSSGISGCMR